MKPCMVPVVGGLALASSWLAVPTETAHAISPLSGKPPVLSRSLPCGA